MKSHRLCGRVGRCHELPNRRDELPDRVVMSGEFAFELVELACQLLVAEDQLPQLDERSHHEHADLNRSRRVQQAGRHERAVLGEGVGTVSPAAVPDT